MSSSTTRSGRSMRSISSMSLALDAWWCESWVVGRDLVVRATGPHTRHRLGTLLSLWDPLHTIVEMSTGTSPRWRCWADSAGQEACRGRARGGAASFSSRHWILWRPPQSAYIHQIICMWEWIFFLKNQIIQFRRRRFLDNALKYLYTSWHGSLSSPSSQRNVGDWPLFGW